MCMVLNGLAHLAQGQLVRHEGLPAHEWRQVAVATPARIWVHVQPVALGDHQAGGREGLARDVNPNTCLKANGVLGTRPAGTKGR